MLIPSLRKAGKMVSASRIVLGMKDLVKSKLRKNGKA
jgi:hypothetical protein